jgi:hypothetical protein
VKFPVGEKALLKKLDALGGALEVSKTNGKKVQSLGSKFRSAMEREHQSVFYRFNVGWIIPGVLLSVAAIIITLVFGRISDATLGLAIPAGIIGVVATALVVSLSKRARASLTGKIQLAAFLFIVSSALVNSGILSASSLLGIGEQPLVIGALASILMLNVFAFFLMGAPTQLGQTRTVEIEGLKRYLSVAEKDRMNMAGAPEMSPEHYETLLPYAMALGVEKPWSKAFQSLAGDSGRSRRCRRHRLSRPRLVSRPRLRQRPHRRHDGQSDELDGEQLHRLAASAEILLVGLSRAAAGSPAAAAAVAAAAAGRPLLHLMA